MFGKRPNILVLLLILLGSNLLVSRTLATVKDSDADGLTDQAEIVTYHTDPTNPDTDGDSFSDSDEILAGTNPLQAENVPTEKVTPPEEQTPYPWALITLSGTIGFILLALISLLSVLRKKGGHIDAPSTPQNPVS